MRRQARAPWELERSVRRAILRERMIVFAGGVLIALAFFAFMLVLTAFL